jgi:enoyl-CoA hydratase/carnithine racemase
MVNTDSEAVKVETLSGSLKGVTVISINRERRKNAVDFHTAQKLYEAFISFEENSTQKICVFHGANGTFCAGADLHALTQSTTQGGPAAMSRVADRNAGPMGPSRLQVKKPVIAAVSGYAVAGGLELSLLADVRVAEEDAVFGVFCRRWGVPLIDGGTVRLQAIIGLGRAMDLILTGRPVNAQEALSMGLANRVVPKGEALNEALRIAEQLLRFPFGCMQTDRASCYYSAYNAKSFEDAMSNEFDNGISVITTESLQGAARFSAGAGRGGSFEKL